MSNNQLNEDDDEELVAVETPLDDDGEDSRIADDEDDDEDERLSESQDDSDGEVTSRNRRKRIKRRDVRKNAKENAERELQYLREQNEALMRRVSAVEGNALDHNELAIDQRFSQAVREAKQAETIIARAVEAGNGDDVAVAMRLRDEANARAQQLYAAKQQVAQAKQVASAPAVDTRVTSLAQEWLAANTWYDPQGRDEESAITKAIDSQLVRDGYNPASIDYWQELTQRVSARLGTDDAPARNTQNGRRKAPPMGNTREHAPASTKREVYVTPERKQAMIDAGIWDDPVKRTRMLKTYQAYDKNSAR